LLLRRIPFHAMLLVKRQPYYSEQPFMDAHHLYNRPGGGIYRLSPVRPEGRLTPVVDSLGEGIYRDVFLNPAATRFLFAFGNGSDKWDGRQSYHIYEAAVDGGDVRQLTVGPKNDCEPFYLPSGQIGFTSDRSEHFVMCGGNRHSPTLFVMESDGSAVRQLSFNVFNDFNPTVLPDGRILYSRWEYNERSVTSLHNPFTIEPNGTMMRPYYGNQTIRPNVVMFPRPVPGSTQAMALFTAHHGQTHGAVGLIDVRRGNNGQGPLTVLTPNVPIAGEKAEDSRYGWYSDPVPLSETTYLCSYTPTVLPWLPASWALYVGDRHGNLALVHRDPEISCAEPVPLVPRPSPHVLPPADHRTDDPDAEATLLLADVYVGLPGVARGTARFLRLLEDVPRKGVGHGGVICTTGTQIYTIKRVLGTVPIEADGSAHFVVPANRNVYFEVLDADHLEIQRMRSVVCLKPGERRTCIGCHEPRNTAPPNLVARALRRAADRPQPPPWGTQIVSYLRDVQPVLNARCVGCHTHDRATNRVVLTDDLTNQFVIGYEELLPYLRVANSFRWDTPDDVYKRPPYTYGSKASPLMKLLAEGHHGVELSREDRQRLVNWIDANGVYYDRYETAHYSNRQIFDGDTRGQLEEVFTRRCAACHGSDAGQHDTWWMSVNRRDPRLSRALMAPLARAAGGWQRCQPAVFADIDDADYRKLHSTLSALHDRLTTHPRADLLSIRGTPAERQQVETPAPPPPKPPIAVELPEGWVHLSDLKWQSATSGWSANGDGLPRRDKDARGQALRLAGRRDSKGIGTHAPSEITYPLGGRYRRFRATVGGAEARGTVTFQVYGDDKRLFDGAVMQGMRGTRQIDVSVVGVRQLRLVVTDAGDGINCDMANWAAARLEKVTDPASE
jgi:mono/diheme cytochrome c family protein